ncbi:hypothetical protein BU14_0077s0047 [Porphyra umbilicalis]|uniref:Uncharacterized protein n=1 Tax=Porphyra umbilicalis TaxID=2786 RepID=A0A1X6PF02_PORUM|nr:hypothetical protein BU14_0077s0047 [Porphyra umbilicalis]|eukprot:OSX79427.1 hypothetical protein BU14_0077s0047 [Porphyra umbilicalis]
MAVIRSGRPPLRLAECPNTTLRTLIPPALSHAQPNPTPSQRPPVPLGRRQPRRQRQPVRRVEADRVVLGRPDDGRHVVPARDKHHKPQRERHAHHRARRGPAGEPPRRPAAHLQRVHGHDAPNDEPRHAAGAKADDRGALARRRIVDGLVKVGAQEDEGGGEGDEGGGHAEARRGVHVRGRKGAEAAGNGVRGQDRRRAEGRGGGGRELRIVGGADRERPTDESDGLPQPIVAKAKGGALVPIAQGDGHANDDHDGWVKARAAGEDAEAREARRGGGQDGHGGGQQLALHRHGAAEEVHNRLGLVRVNARGRVKHVVGHVEPRNDGNGGGEEGPEAGAGEAAGRRVCCGSADEHGRHRDGVHGGLGGGKPEAPPLGGGGHSVRGRVCGGGFGLCVGHCCCGHVHRGAVGDRRGMGLAAPHGGVLRQAREAGV